jgi:hypothetical protein
MLPKNLFAVVFITGSLGLGALVACGKGGEAQEVKNPSAEGLTPGVHDPQGAVAAKDKAPGATTTPDTKGAMGGGTDRSAAEPGGPAPTAAPGPNVVDHPKSGPAPTATHPTGPAPRNTGDPPPDPNRHEH